MTRANITGMTTQWAHITRISWAQAVGIEPASDLIAGFLTPGDVQIIPPDRKTGDADSEVLPPLQTRGLNFVAAPRPSSLFIHPTPHQIKQMTLSTLTADQAFVILWSTNRTFEGWLAAQDWRNLEATEARAAVDPVVARGIVAVAGSSNPSEGITHGYGKNLVIDALRKLLHAGYVIDGPGLEAAGFTAGLRWDDVAQLRTYADGLTAGHQYRTGPDSYRADIVDLWRQQAAPSDRATADRSPEF